MSELKKKTIQRLFLTLWFIITVIVLLVMVFMLYKLVQENSNLVSSVINTSPQTLPGNPQQQVSHNKSVNLYLPSKEKICLHPIEVQIEWKASYQENCKQIINAMKSINIENYISIIPDDINPRGVYLTPEGELIIDIPAIIISRYEKDTTALFESLFTYSIVNSLLQKELMGDTETKGVRFLIEGAVPTGNFPKHVSWGQLFTPDYSLICNE